MIKIIKYENIKEYISNTFSKIGIKASRAFGEIVLGLLGSESCKLPEIAVSMSSNNGKDMNTNLRRIERYTQNKSIEIGDGARRAHINLIFNLLKENGYIEKGQIIPINVDFTSSTNKFLILSASIPFYGRYLPLYFSMRVYPKKKGQIDQKKMEKAFLKELKHLLSWDYKYVIVADRGFGNTRFMEDCTNTGFEYLVRTNDNWNIEYLGERTNIKNLTKKNKDINGIELTTSGIKTRLVMSFPQLHTNGRYIFTSLKKEKVELIIQTYSQRFKIEKMFQDEKSSGFKIEESKIKYYDRFKRLLFGIYVAQAIMIFIGDYVNNNEMDLKKRYPIYLNLILAFLN